MNKTAQDPKTLTLDQLRWFVRGQDLAQRSIGATAEAACIEMLQRLIKTFGPNQPWTAEVDTWCYRLDEYDPSKVVFFHRAYGSVMSLEPFPSKELYVDMMRGAERIHDGCVDVPDVRDLVPDDVTNR